MKDQHAEPQNSNCAEALQSRNAKQSAQANQKLNANHAVQPLRNLKQRVSAPSLQSQNRCAQQCAPTSLQHQSMVRTLLPKNWRPASAKSKPLLQSPISRSMPLLSRTP